MDHAPRSPSENWTGVTRVLVKFTPADPREPIPVDTLLGFMQAALNEFFYMARINGCLELSHIGGEIFVVGEGGIASKG